MGRRGKEPSRVRGCIASLGFIRSGNRTRRAGPKRFRQQVEWIRPLMYSDLRSLIRREWRNLADAPDLGSGARKGVGVQIPPLAHPRSIP
jgi:hypothetical protein